MSPTHNTARRGLALAGASLAVTVLAACQSDHYAWGRYQDSLQAMYLEPGSIDVADEVGRLAEQIERTVHENKIVPPGLRAHLAYLHYQTGNSEAARALFSEEKAAFPESAVFVDGMLSRMGK